MEETRKPMVHENRWTWGKTASIVIADGAAIVDMSFEDDNPGVCYISGLSVVPWKRRQGLATNLMEECEYYCIKRGIFRIDLNSVQEPFVMDFYHKLGYTDIKENDGYMRMFKMLYKPPFKPI